ncbi:MAG: hypothetical protein MMC23_001111 [Stictis urceolatum]|nr:hypothetical protein [Stictis urceolata]
MVKLSFPLVASVISTLVAGQVTQTQLPEISAPANGGCGGCYVVADVAGIVFGGVSTQTAVRQISVGVSPNGTNVTTVTSIVQETGLFTFDPSGLASQAPVSYHPLNSTVIVGGATLTSPTSYELFSAYSITSYTQGDNGCSTIRGSRFALPSAYSFEVPENAGDDFLIQAEQSFIDALGLTCSAGGGNVQTTIQSMLSSTTVDMTTAGPIRPTPVAASVAASASTATPSATIISSESSSASATIISGASSSASMTSAPSGVASASAPIATTYITFGNATFMPTGTIVGPSYTYTPIVGAAATAAPALVGSAAVFALGLAAVLL